MHSKDMVSVFISMIGVLFFSASDSPEGFFSSQEPSAKEVQTGPDHIVPDMGCTVIYATDGANMLGGNNEDYWDPFTMAWFFPPEDGAYGRVYFGYEGFIWGGGLNDQGLFFDALAIDQPITVIRDGKPVYEGTLPDKAMAECGTIDCVIELFSQYHTYDTWYHQFMFGDAQGNSVIIEPNTYLRSEKNYQVATNFYQSMTDIPTCSTCTRYKTATSMLENATEFSVELMRDILDAVHFDDGNPTLYSNIYDLKTGTIYLYHFHDFDHVVVLQLDEKLAKGYHSYYLADLFPENEDFLSFAQPRIDHFEAIRATYPDFEAETALYEEFVGDYKVPVGMRLPYPFYSIALENETLYLKVKPDKVWLALRPISQNSFYHVSSFNHFEVTFLQDDDGRVRQFEYTENGAVYTFNRLEENDPEPPTATIQAPTLTPDPTQTDIPTSTKEREKPSESPMPIANTQAVPDPTPILPMENPETTSSWWIYPLTGLIIFTGWYLSRKGKA